jgi:membrane protease YdiL (CAAX protease family)
VRPAGWHPDPLGHYPYRYWNGEIWTAHVYGSAAALAPYMPAPHGSSAPRFRGSGAMLVSLTLLGLIVAFGLSLLAVLVDIGLHRPGGVLVTLVVSEAGLWTGLLGTCVVVSRRLGSRSLRRDLDIYFRWSDIGIGLLAAVVAHFLGGLAILPILRAHPGLSNPDNSLFGSTTVSVAGWVVLVLITCVGAPIFEELYFRGLLQKVLTERIGTVAGVLTTAAVFGACHIANDPGWNGIVYAVGIGVSGIVLGCVKLWTAHLGASMATHCVFNTIAVVALAVELYH